MGRYFMVEGVNRLQSWSRQAKSVSVLLGTANHELSPTECHGLAELLDHLLTDLDGTVDQMWAEYHERRKVLFPEETE